MTGLKPRAEFNHVGMTVPNLEEAIRWYTEVLGFELLAEPMHSSSYGPLGDHAMDLLGDWYREGAVAHLMSSNGFGLELFEFIDPPTIVGDPVDFRRVGVFHICITWPDVEEMVEHIVANGGKLRTKVWHVLDRITVAYCEDPYGNVIEVLNIDYASFRKHDHNVATKGNTNV